MDDSGSMFGGKWDNVKAGASSFLQEIAKNNLSKVTVIVFNHYARCVIDFEDLDPINQDAKITYKGGNTDFDFAFQLAFEKIINNSRFAEFDSHQMFFYTDGYAAYPGKAVQKFQQLSIEQKQKLQLIAQEAQSPVLEQIVADFIVDLDYNLNQLNFAIELRQLKLT